MSNKQAIDKARREPNIKMGDLVLLSTYYLLLSSSPGKLKPCFVGPFQVTKVVRANTFKLELPTIIKVHPVFSVSFFCKFQGKYKLTIPIIVNGEAEYEVEKIVRHRTNGKYRQ